MRGRGEEEEGEREGRGGEEEEGQRERDWQHGQ